MTGRGGNDVYYVDAPRTTIFETADGGTDEVRASISHALAANVERLVLTGTASGGTGNEQDNTIYGNDAANLLSGAGGDDTIYAGEGDTVDGGASDYDLVVLGLSAPVVVTLADSGDGTIVYKGRTTAIRGIENVILSSSSSDDVIFGNASGNILDGYGGDDTINGRGGLDQLYGGYGFDTADFTGETASLRVALTGDDPYLVTADGLTYSSISGFEAVTGGSGGDTLIGSKLRDLLHGGAGDDVVISGGSDFVSGRDELLFGDAGDDRIFSDGNGTADGGDGADILYLSKTYLIFGIGGNGLDVADFSTVEANYHLDVDLSVTDQAGASHFELRWGTGPRSGQGSLISIESINGTSEGDVVKGGNGRNDFSGADGDDQLQGAGGNDRLTGDLGTDQLTGGKGADLFEGGAGQDLLSGGRGADRFVFSAADMTGNSPSLADEVLDFSRKDGDRIDLHKIDANVGSGRDNAFVFIGDQYFSGVAGELRCEVYPTATYVFGDIDGDAIGDFVIKLDDVTLLKPTDFVL